MIKINYSHLCEKAFLSQNGNLNLIGIFERIIAQKLPLVFPQLAIVSSLEGDHGQHKMTIKIINAHNKKEIIKAIQLNIDIKPVKKENAAQKQNLRIIGEINNLKIEEIGHYEIQIFLNNELVYTTPFAVEKHVQPIPEGR